MIRFDIQLGERREKSMISLRQNLSVIQQEPDIKEWDWANDGVQDGANDTTSFMLSLPKIVSGRSFVWLLNMHMEVTEQKAALCL